MTDTNTSLSPLIHLVDDDAAVRESLALLIATVGLRVQTWGDPHDFLATFERAHIGAIVRDTGEMKVVQMEGFLVDKRVPRVIIPHHDTVIEENDHVVVFCTRKREVPQVEKLFQVGFQFL